MPTYSEFLGMVLGVSLAGCDDAPPPAPPPPQTREAAPAASSAALPVLPPARPVVGEHYRSCDRVDATVTHFAPWEDLHPFGGLAMPLEKKEATLPLVIHLHGQLGAVLELDRARADVALAGVSFSPGTYAGHFGVKGVFASMVRGARSKAKPYLADDALYALSAWSNGYEAVRALLKDGAIDAKGIVLLDAIHGADDEKSRRIQLEPFTEWARRARRGEAFMFISHSGVGTTGYASTTTSTDTLLEELGEPLPPFESVDLAGDTVTRSLHEGGLYVLGFKGGDRDAHCRQITLLPYALELMNAWARGKAE